MASNIEQLESPQETDNDKLDTNKKIADQTIIDPNSVNTNKSPKVSPRALMSPPSAHFFVQPGTPFENQLFWQKYSETLVKYAPLLTQNPAANVPPTNSVKKKLAVSSEKSITWEKQHRARRKKDSKAL